MFTEVELYLEVFPVRAPAAAATSELSTVAVAVVVVVVPHAVREENKIQHIKNTSQYRVAVGQSISLLSQGFTAAGPAGRGEMGV